MRVFFFVTEMTRLEQVAEWRKKKTKKKEEEEKEEEEQMRKRSDAIGLESGQWGRREKADVTDRPRRPFFFLGPAGHLH